MIPSDLSFDAIPVHHLPLVRALVTELGIEGTLDDKLPMDPRSNVSDADCVAVMILNILQGRVALYRMNEWLEHVDMDVIVGEGCEPEHFNDARLAATLDRIFEAGTDDILAEVAGRYLAGPRRPDIHCIHGDTTSLALYGAYDTDPPPGAPVPLHGFSKDHRPDLKQIIFGLNLHGAAGVPLAMSVLDGNTTDHQANRLHIDKLAKLLPRDEEVTFVADCKLVDAKTLGHLAAEGFHFISLVPHSFKLRSTLVEQVRGDGELPELAREPGRTATHPPRVYSGRSHTAAFPVQDPDIEGKDGLRTERMRFLVVESSQLAERFEKSLPDKLDREQQKFEKAFRRAAKRSFGCREDAEAARDKLVAGLAFHQARVAVVDEQVTLKRKRRGRPRKDERPETRTEYRLRLDEVVRDQEKIDARRLQARHFVLVTDHLDEEEWPDEAILAEYRHQHLVEGHCGFRWFKSTAAVAPAFLKKPHRIAALCLVFVLALMVRNYLQFTLRRRLFEVGETVPYYGNKPPTDSPTAEVALNVFAGVQVVRISRDGEVIERRIGRMSEAAARVLELLGIDAEVFTRVRRKIGVGVGRTSGM